MARGLGDEFRFSVERFGQVIIHADAQALYFVGGVGVP